MPINRDRDTAKGVKGRNVGRIFTNRGNFGSLRVLHWVRYPRG
jgi:hypothetical protein